jgi:hypothetical protein
MTRPEANTTVVGVLEEALERHGVLEGELLHDEFASPSHPLHAMLEWDDKVAGRAHRVGQINRIIRIAYIEFVRPDDTTGRVRRYTPVRYTGNAERLKGYVRTEDVVMNPLQARALLREYERWLKQGRERFANLRQFIELMQQGEQGEETG